MSKVIVIPNSYNMLEKCINNCDAILIGLKDFSTNLPIYFDMNDIVKINKKVKENNKELFISLNKNMFNSDLTVLKEILIKLDTLDIEGIFFYDVSIVGLKKELNIKTDLVWSQEHFTTNFATINYWNKKGVKYTRVSNEITMKEIENISNNTDSKLILPVFGYLPMFMSKRKLVTNYKKYFNLCDDSKLYYMYKENKKYPIVENDLGTCVYTDEPINLYNEYDSIENVVDYVILNSFLIDEDEFMKVLDYYKTKQENDVIKKYNNSFFMHKESIYKVKK